MQMEKTLLQMKQMLFPAFLVCNSKPCLGLLVMYPKNECRFMNINHLTKVNTAQSN